MNKRLKNWIAGGLAMTMLCGMLAGCGGQSADDNNAANNAPGSEAVNGSGTANGENGDSDLAAYFAGKDHYTLKVMIFGDADTGMLEKVSAALSEITEPKLNCDVELTRVGFGSYMQQLNLMLSSGDEFDLFIPLASPIDYVNAGQIQPVGDLLDEFAPNLMGQITEQDLMTQTFSGEIYGMPINSEKGSTLGVAMNGDICEELGIDYESISSWDDLHEALVKVKENKPDMYPIVSNGGAMFSSSAVLAGQDNCGDSYSLAVLENPFGDDHKIVSWFDTDHFKEICTRMYSWAQEGLIMPDASTNSDSSDLLMSSDKAFGYFMHMKPGYEIEASANTGKNIVGWQYGVPTYTGSQLGWFVPTNSGDPERAVAFFDLMYTDKTVANIVINGLEGETYVFEDEANGIIKYPDGMDGASTPYSRLAWAWPNQRIGYFMVGEDTTIWDQYAEFEKTAQVPASFGFTFDATPVMNEVTACTNVFQKYVPALLCGSLNPEETIPILQEEMERAGIQRIIDEKQAQFDAFTASH